MRRKASAARYGVTAGLVQIVGGDGASSAQLPGIRHFPGVRWKWLCPGNFGYTTASVSVNEGQPGVGISVVATALRIQSRSATALEAASAESWDA